MKSVKIILSVFAVSALILTSCTSDKPKSVSLGSEIDSLNYALGYANGKIIKQYHLQNDSTGENLKALLEGIKAGLKEEALDQELASVAELGKSIGTQLKTAPDFYGDSALTVDYKLIRQGLINGILDEKTGMDVQAAQTYFNSTMEAIQSRKVEEQYKDNKLAGETFLKENAKREGVVTTATGLQYEIIKKGTGALPSDTSQVKVHYHGTLVDGTVFDSSVERKEPATFGVDQVIPGWTEGLQLMPVGSKFKFYIPQNLAYAAQNRGKILPFSALIFEVELLSIEK